MSLNTALYPCMRGVGSGGESLDISDISELNAHIVNGA